MGFTTTEAVDLDASCAQFDAQGNIIDKVWFRHLASNDGAIKHSGDDLTGDMDGDDGLDNEVITVDLHKVNPRTDKIAFVLNSFRGQDFKLIPLRLLEFMKELLQRYGKYLLLMILRMTQLLRGVYQW